MDKTNTDKTEEFDYKRLSSSDGLPITEEWLGNIYGKEVNKAEAEQAASALIDHFYSDVTPKERIGTIRMQLAMKYGGLPSEDVSTGGSYYKGSMIHVPDGEPLLEELIELLNLEGENL